MYFVVYNVDHGNNEGDDDDVCVIICTLRRHLYGREQKK